MTGVTSRPLTGAERYYAFLDHVAPMNLLLMADLDSTFALDEIEKRWTQFVRLRAIPRLRVMEDLRLADRGPDRVDFRGLEAPSDTWHALMAQESLTPFGFDRPMRLLYLVSPAEARSRLVFVVHHSVLDGRIGIPELQWLIRFIDGQQIPAQQGLTLPLPRPQRFDWQTDRKRLAEVLRSMSARRAALGAPEPTEWPHRAGDPAPRFCSLTIEGDDARTFLAAAKSHGTRAYSAMAATWLRVAAERLVGSSSATLQLSTPTDLAVPSDDPDRATSPVVSVIGSRYRLEADHNVWDLASQITANVDAAAALGEDELFFHLSRVESIADLDRGVRTVARSLDSAPPAVSVTNLGVIDPGSDPDWVRAMCGYLAATPNQIVFVSGLGYRGRLVHSMATDDGQLAPETAADMIAGYEAQVLALGREAARASLRS